MKYLLIALCAWGVLSPAYHHQLEAVATGSDEIVDALAALDDYAEIQQTLKIQNGDLAYGIRKAWVLADLLLDSNGQLQVDLCQPAKAAFVPQNPRQYEVDIGHVLDNLDGSWQNFFDAIHAPTDPASAANGIIRAFLGLQPSQAITDRDAQVTVLSGLFAPYNQGPVGDCFAVAGLIRDHEDYIEHGASDLAEIANNGYITREVNGTADNFFFINVIADGDAETAFTLDAAGTIQGTDVSLLDVPGFAAASTVMGGNQDAQLLPGVLELLFQGNTTGTVQVSPQQVVNALAQVIAAATPGADQTALYNEGIYAFSCLTNHPLLRAAECAFAAMAEDRSQDYIRGLINQSVAKALQSEWGWINSADVNTFRQQLANTLNASFRLVYNPSIPLAQVAADGSSSEGGFQLYQRTPNDPNHIGTHVATPQDFRAFILSVLAMTESALPMTSKQQNLGQQLITFIDSDAFLQAVFYAYDSANRSVSNPVANYLSLSSTPMQTCDGDNPYEVDDIDAGVNCGPDVVAYTPRNTQDLLTWCLALAKQSSQALFPMTSPQHAFNFDPTNPDIQAFLQSGATSDQWIRQQLIVPSLQIATRTIDAQTQATLASQVYTVLDQIVSSDNYNTMVTQLNAKPLTVQAYAQNLLSGIQKIVWLNAAQSRELALILDMYLIQALPQSDRTTLQQAAIKFAFTNWNDGTKDIYFCGFLNLRTGQIAFASIDEDKTNLSPIDESAWVNQQQWSVDLSLHDEPANVFVSDN